MTPVIAQFNPMDHLMATLQNFPELCFRLQEQFKQAAIQHCFHMAGLPTYQLLRDGTIRVSFETESPHDRSQELVDLNLASAVPEVHPGERQAGIQVAFTEMGQMWFRLLDGPWQGLQEAAMQFDRAFFGITTPPLVHEYVRVKR
ncbi:hypothetical protein [Deinococcus cellulosilyticus]|uniref:Uncharacterized protein n=1 Tax=Deinococcus cellulosilyticus (strain DSM 18568 / NBRC 106333 / KACC 11606 / 5516J-15) TaxID=1223518 RepID=A0A511NBB5_DEIC1|nr:hypothetical protein [Deinococcus cellulosilyticus]GEM50094.1 hypothetical protein DC3_57290 [Deinococcus cellulosilyticus NBRC 106333 = KACC 11606]